MPAHAWGHNCYRTTFYRTFDKLKWYIEVSWKGHPEKGDWDWNVEYRLLNPVSNIHKTISEYIKPPIGTRKSEIDFIFGEPQVIPELKGKGNPHRYPMHSYTLKTLSSGSRLKLTLNVTCKAGLAQYVSISHPGITKGRPADTPEHIKLKDRVIRLEDYLRIYEAYEAQLETAAWNKPLYQ